MGSRMHASQSRSLLAVAAWATLLVSPAVVAADPPGSPASRTPEVRSHAFYVLDESDESVLAARHEDVPAPIASITKLMTALVVLEAGQSLEDTLSITVDDVRGTPGSGSRLSPGVKMSRGDMLHLALMSSENRAAHALCRQYPGGTEACVQAMNDKAAALGMSSAHFVEPTGLSSSNVASPRDLARLVVAASRDERIRDYSTDVSHTIYVNRQPLEFRNTNVLVQNPSWEVSLQKTGYISAAGRCLVMETVVNGRDVVIVLLNSWGRLTRIADAKRIRAWLEAQRRTADTGLAAAAQPFG